MKGQKNFTLAVYDSIKEMMFNYDIIPGQRLVFVDLAKKLGVSRTPVNNALSILAKEGYLDFIPNQGYSVHILTREEAESLYEIREILEVGTIGKAIRQSSDKKIMAIKKKMQQYSDAISDRVRRELFVIDMEFHAGIIDMMGNAYLSDRYRDICQKIFLRFRTEDLKIDRIKVIVKEHEKLYEAVRVKDVAWAKELIARHHRNSKENLFKIIFQKENRLKIIKS